MINILAYMPTFSPNDEASGMSRPHTRLSNEEIKKRLRRQSAHKPAVYMDAIDSIMNNPTQVKLVVADGRSTESIRAEMSKHHRAAGGYDLDFYSGIMSQWVIFNDIIKKYATPETAYFVYSSSDVIWHHDWVAEAIKEFEKNPKLQILFPCVSRGDMNLPCQIAGAARDIDPFEPPYQRAARAPCLNMYAGIFRMDFLRAYGGYPTRWKNCFSESTLYYMAEALGGKIMVMPRGHVFHHSSLDVWKDEAGSTYNYLVEKHTFDPIMDRILEARANDNMTVAFLSELLKCRNS